MKWLTLVYTQHGVIVFVVHLPLSAQTLVLAENTVFWEFPIILFMPLPLIPFCSSLVPHWHLTCPCHAHACLPTSSQLSQCSCRSFVPLKVWCSKLGSALHSVDCCTFPARSNLSSFCLVHHNLCLSSVPFRFPVLLAAFMIKTAAAWQLSTVKVASFWAFYGSFWVSVKSGVQSSHVTLWSLTSLRYYLFKVWCFFNYLIYVVTTFSLM